MPAELRMLRMHFDVAKLFELGRRRGLPLRDVDLGYLLHCAVCVPAGYGMSVEVYF